VAGLIDKVLVDRGTVVRRGMPLVTLESSVERAAVDLAAYKAQLEGQLKSGESRVVHAQARLQRRAELAELNYGSAQDREDAEVELGTAQADVQSARENRQLARLEHAYAAAQLAQRTLRSPIDGIVVEQLKFPGEMAEFGEGKPYILKLVQTQPLRVKAILPVALFNRVKPGQRAEVVPEKPLDGRYAANVSHIDRAVDAASGTFQVRLELPNPGGMLPVGLKCRLSLPGL
jgi:RND family efflux transporter MFP subunit